MQYGAMNFPVKPLLEEIRKIGERGFDYVELAMDPPEATPEKVRERKEEILRILKQYGMGLVVHLPTFVSTADLSQRLREASLREIFAAMDVGIVLGVRKMVLHPGYVTGMAVFVRERAKLHALESLQRIYERACELGVTLCLENLPPRTSFCDDLDDFAELFSRFPELKLTLDTGHANLATRGKGSIAFLTKLGERLGHLHFNDNLGKEDTHLPVGAGTIEFEDIIQEIVRIGYDDTLTVEVFSRDRDHVRSSREKIKTLLRRYATR